MEKSLAPHPLHFLLVRLWKKDGTLMYHHHWFVTGKKKKTPLPSSQKIKQDSLKKCPSETSLQYKEFRNPKKLFTAPCTPGYEEKSTKKQLSAPRMYALWTPTQHHGSTTALKERKAKP
jgi:hypothetical protein